VRVFLVDHVPNQIRNQIFVPSILSSPNTCTNLLRHVQVGEPCVCRLSRVLEKNGSELRSLILAGNK
jgi:hypothetical protein